MEDETGAVVEPEKQLTFEAFAELLDQKPKFESQCAEQAQRLTDFMRKMGKNPREIRKAFGLMSARKPKKTKAAGPGRPRNTPATA